MFTGVNTKQFIFWKLLFFFVIYHLLGHTNRIKQKKYFKFFQDIKKKNNSPIKYKYTILF